MIKLQGVPSTLSPGLIQHLTKLLSLFCQIPTCPVRIRNTHKSLITRLRRTNTWHTLHSTWARRFILGAGQFLPLLVFLLIFGQLATGNVLLLLWLRRCRLLLLLLLLLLPLDPEFLLGRGVPAHRRIRHGTPDNIKHVNQYHNILTGCLVNRLSGQP